jgi:hypothetical protein
MESPNSEQQAGLKRKRSPVPGAGEDGRTAVPGGSGSAAMGTGNVTQINYLVRAKAERLRLIEGDGEAFGDVLGMIDDYEGMFGHGISGWSKSPLPLHRIVLLFHYVLLCLWASDLLCFTDFRRCTSTSRKFGCQSWSEARWSFVAEVLREVIRWPYQGRRTIVWSGPVTRLLA